MTQSAPPGTTELLAEIEALMARTGISKTAFGINATNDPRLVGDIAGGRNLTLRTISRIRDCIARDGRAA